MNEVPASLGCSEGDAVLAALGARRLEIPVPFASTGGRVNVYLIDNPDGTLTLFDTGIATEEGTAALVAGFSSAGRKLDGVTRILISHGHVDHYGLARFIQERSGAKVYVHPADRNKVMSGGSLSPMKGYLSRLGVPAPLIDRLAGQYVRTQAYGRELETVEPLAEGQRFGFARFEGEILHCPGHTPGLVCLHAPAQRILFTDDHVLALISPNPLLEIGARGEEDKFQALVAYLASARRILAMDLDWLMPGHGVPFQGHRSVLESQFRFYERRQARMEEVLEGAPQTAYALVSAIFPAAGEELLFLTLSEIVGNLEVLESQRRVTRDVSVSPYLYRKRIDRT